MTRSADEIKAHLGQAVTNLQAAKEWLEKGQYGAAASSAAEAALHSGSALLLDEGIETTQHEDVATLVHQIFVNQRRLTHEQGEKLTWLFQLGQAQKSDTEPVPPLIPGEAQKAVEFAEHFFDAAKIILES